MKIAEVKNRGTIVINDTSVGETIETKVRRITTNKEPIKDGAPLAYTDRADGVLPAYNIRTDRFEVALDAMDRVTASVRAKRDSKPKTGIETDSKPKTGIETTPTEGGSGEPSTKNSD